MENRGGSGYAWATPPLPVRVGKVGSDWWDGSYRDGEWGDGWLELGGDLLGRITRDL